MSEAIPTGSEQSQRESSERTLRPLCTMCRGTGVAQGLQERRSAQYLIEFHDEWSLYSAFSLSFIDYIPKRQKSLKAIVATAAKRPTLAGADYRPVKGKSSSSPQQQQATQQNSAQNAVEKGEEKLQKAKRTLDTAKIEAQSTLAPILERMKNSRKIRNAEKVLKRMSHLLEYPYKMRQALNRGDLSEVVSLYQRIQAMPSSSSALRLLTRVKDAAEVVIGDLKGICVEVLLKPNTDYMALLRHGKLILDLEGNAAYIAILRRSLLRHVAHVVATVKQLKTKFLVELMDAFKNGQDLNIMRQNAIVREVGLDGVYEAENALATRRQINSSRRGSGHGTTSLKFGLGAAAGQDEGSVMGGETDSVTSDSVRRMSHQRDDFDLYDDDTDDEMLDLESLLEDGASFIVCLSLPCL